MNARILDVYINMATGAECDSAGRPKQLLTRVNRTDRVLFRWHLFADDTLAPYALPTGLTFAFGGDTLFTPGNADLVTSTNDRFNAADWAGDTGWSLANGRISCLAVFNTTQLATVMGSSIEAKLYVAVYATPAGSDPFLLFQIPLFVNGVAVESGGGAQANEVDSYITVSALAAFLQIPAGKRLRVTEAGDLIVENIS